MKFEAESPRICQIFEITRTIYSNSEKAEQFKNRKNIPVGFSDLIYVHIRKIIMQIGKIIGIYKHAGKVSKHFFSFVTSYITKGTNTL